MWTSKQVKCPVCNEVIGRTTLNARSEYPCKECQWIFPTNAEGEFGSPIKMNPRKPNVCTCEGCKYRDQQELLTRIKRM